MTPDILESDLTALAPTVLSIMGIEKSESMTGESLFVKKEEKVK